MALTPEQIDGLPDYATAQLLKLVEYAIVKLTAGLAEHSIEGVGSFRQNDLDRLQAWRNALRQQLASETADAAAAAGDTSAYAPVTQFVEGPT